MKCDFAVIGLGPMYCSHFDICGVIFKMRLSRLIVVCKHYLRIIMNYPRRCSASVFVFNDVLSFNELWRKVFLVLGSVLTTSLTRLLTQLLKHHFKVHS